MNSPRDAAFRRAQDLADGARSWLLDSAAPLWSRLGRTSSGLFAERIDLQGNPDPSVFRTFVQARHIYSFTAIGRMGWTGPWRELVAETVDLLLTKAKRADGLFVHKLNEHGLPSDSRADLYDQAFVLLALGRAASDLNKTMLFDEAEVLISRLHSLWAHPSGGFREGEVAVPTVRRQNPHMHLLEAFLCLAEESGRGRFQAEAEAIANLASTKFLDADTGAMLEYFRDDLARAEGEDGRVVEPGHCFEWAWLFEKLASAGSRQAVEFSDGLTRFARTRGIDHARNVAVNEVGLDGVTRDDNARLWPQTERLKAAVARWKRLQSGAEGSELTRAAAGLQPYLQVSLQGLWRDKLCHDGRWIEEFAPGSSLYHISCAFEELHNLARGEIQ